MKWTTDPVTQVLAKLRDSAALQGVDFCRAYPDQMKPSRLLRPVVAVCLAEMDGTSDAVGEESRAGQIALRFDLYAPPGCRYWGTATGALRHLSHAAGSAGVCGVGWRAPGGHIHRLPAPASHLDLSGGFRRWRRRV